MSASVNAKNRTLFLDRDGTINVDLGTYVSYAKDLRLIPGAASAIIRAHKAGFKVAVITNQAGVAKGITPAENIPQIHARMEELIRQETGESTFRFDNIQVCMHHPKDKCACRKPGNKMVLDAAAKLGTDFSNSFYVGDKTGDLGCAKTSGLTAVLVLTGYGKETLREVKEETPEIEPAHVAEDLPAAVDWILSQGAKH